MTEIASSSAAGPPPGMRVRLSSNESPIGPAPGAIAAAQQALMSGHLYPDDQSIALRDTLATHLGVARDNVAVGNGSAALLMDAIAADAAQNSEVLTFARSFIVYRLAAANAGARYVEAPTGDAPTQPGPGYVRDVERLLAEVTPRTRVIAIDNPGNPTGAHLAPDALQFLLDNVPDSVTILIDEAYQHFAVDDPDYAQVATLDVRHPRVVTLGTFSKAHALAGMRIGFVAGPQEIITRYDARRARFNVTAPAQAAAIASLADNDHLSQVVDMTRNGRDHMAKSLREAGIVFTEGRGNFLTIELGGDARPVVDAFAEHGVGVRDLYPYDMPTQIRVTVGTPDHVDQFCDVARTLLTPRG